jgi:hypothetical protein
MPRTPPPSPEQIEALIRRAHLLRAQWLRTTLAHAFATLRRMLAPRAAPRSATAGR